MLKLSTTSVKLMGCQSCFQYPGVTLLWRYPALSSRSFSNSWAMMPPWGSPYIPRQTSQWTLPVASTLLRKSYSWMLSSGKSSIFIRKNLYRFIGVQRKKSLMSMDMNFALGVDIMLLNRSLTVRRSAVGVPQSPG